MQTGYGHFDTALSSLVFYMNMFQVAHQGEGGEGGYGVLVNGGAN